MQRKAVESWKKVLRNHCLRLLRSWVLEGCLDGRMIDFHGRTGTLTLMCFVVQCYTCREASILERIATPRFCARHNLSVYCHEARP